MFQKSASFKKKEHFLQLISSIPQEKILFSPIDVSKHFHVSLFHDIFCKPITEFIEFSSSQIGFDLFISKLKPLISTHAPEIILIGCEPTNVYYEGLIQNLNLRYKDSSKPRVQLCILDPLAVKENRKQHSLHFSKSDFIDCAAIDELMTRGLYSPAFFVSPESLQIKELSHSINNYRKEQLQSWMPTLTTLDRVFPNLLIDYKDEKPLCKNPLKSSLLQDLIRICPDPARLIQLSVQQLIDLFHEQKRPLGQKRAQKLFDAAHRSLLLDQRYQTIYLNTLSHQLQTLDFLTARIENLTSELCKLIHLTPARHLLKIAGNSEKPIADFLAALSDPHRFSFVEQVWKAAGLAPTLTQSGQKELYLTSLKQVRFISDEPFTR
jgi:hypothetical protein